MVGEHVEQIVEVAAIEEDEIVVEVLEEFAVVIAAVAGVVEKFATEIAVVVVTVVEVVEEHVEADEVDGPVGS